MGWQQQYRMFLLIIMVIVGALTAVNCWQDSLSEDQTWIWSCHTMGDRHCRTDEPMIQVKLGNLGIGD